MSSETNVGRLKRKRILVCGERHQSGENIEALYCYHDTHEDGYARYASAGNNRGCVQSDCVCTRLASN